MTDYRTLLTSLVAVFLALGFGMLVGSALVSTPSPKAQQMEMRRMWQSFNEFRQENADIRTDLDSMTARLHREDGAIRQTLLPRVDHRLAGRRVAIILCGDFPDERFLSDLDDALEQAGGTVSSTTRLTDDWIPADDTARGKLLDVFGLTEALGTNARITASLARALALGHEDTVNAAAQVASGLRLNGDYTLPANGVIVISGTRTPERFAAVRVGATPETALLTALRDSTNARTVAAELDGSESLSTIPFFNNLAPATVDNIDMASGQFSAIYALAGRDGHFGIKRSAERPIPDLTP